MINELPILLSIENLNTSFNTGGNRVDAVKNVSLTIYEGETLALVGESGSGKSVLAHSILRLLPYPKAYHSQGKIVFQGKDLLTVQANELREIRGKDVGMIFQEPMSALNPLQTIETQIAECLQSKQNLSSQKRRQAVIALLEKVKIPDPASRLNSYPHELSGGQRQRVMIAMAIANQPKLLIADEPTTALDVTIQAEILHLLEQIQQETKMSILFITHDLHVVKHVADRVAVMKSGEIIEIEQQQQLFDYPQHPYTQMLLRHEIQDKNPLQSSNKTILSTKNIQVKFKKNSTRFFAKADFFYAVKNASITLQKGETLGIVGESGCGKSTLANAILKLVKSDGDIILDDICISTLSEKQFRPMRRKLQIVFQDPFASLSPRMTIAQIVGEGLRNRKIAQATIEQEVIHVLTTVGIDPAFRFRYPHEFSGGQRQRIAIARAIIMKPDCIVLDEPTSALDRSVQFQVLDLLLQLQRELSLTYLFISHDLRLIKAFCHHVAVMKEGEIIEYGLTENVFNSPANAYTTALIKATL